MYEDTGKKRRVTSFPLFVSSFLSSSTLRVSVLFVQGDGLESSPIREKRTCRDDLRKPPSPRQIHRRALFVYLIYTYTGSIRSRRVSRCSLADTSKTATGQRGKRSPVRRLNWSRDDNVGNVSVPLTLSREIRFRRRILPAPSFHLRRAAFSRLPLSRSFTHSLPSSSSSPPPSLPPPTEFITHGRDQRVYAFKSTVRYLPAGNAN